MLKVSKVAIQPRWERILQLQDLGPLDKVRTPKVIGVRKGKLEVRIITSDVEGQSLSTNRVPHQRVKH